MTEIHYTSSFEEAHAVRAHLESQGIAATVHSGQFANFDGGALLLPPPVSSLSVRVVLEEDFARAKAIVEEFLARREEDEDVESSDWRCEGCGEMVEGQFGECWNCGASASGSERSREIGEREAAVISSTTMVDAETDVRDTDVDDEAGASDVDAGPSIVRSARELWIEVGVVLMLAVIPYLVYGLWSYFTRQRGGDIAFLEYAVFHVVGSLQVTAPVLYILWRSREPLDQFGLPRPRWLHDVTVAFVLFVLIFAFDGYFYWMVVDMLPWKDLRFEFPSPSGGFEIALLVVMEAANGFAEELVMRGYLIPRFERLLGSTAKSVILASVLFASYHIYQGIAVTVDTFVLGLVFGMMFCVVRRVWPLALAHALYNLAAEAGA